MYVDTHAHLQFDTYEEDRELVIQRAIKNNVTAIITIGTDVETSSQAVFLAEKYVSVYAAVGIHPTDCKNVTTQDFYSIEKLAGHQKVVAIGEVGLDYYHMRADKQTQDRVFSRQIGLAREMNLPLIIHNRDSHDDMFDLLVRERIGPAGGVMHSFSGDEEFLTKVLELDLHVSFTGNITFKNSTSEGLIKKTPPERLLLETDSPFLTPVPLRGKRNEPAFLIHTAQKIAGIKEMSTEDIARVTTENAIKLFKLNL